jgi:undecaprenyl-diphosphatase
MEQIHAADLDALSWFGNRHSTAGDALMKSCTHLGDASVMAAVAVLFALMLYFLAGKRRTALILLLASLVAVGFTRSTKYLFDRPRPNVSWRLVPLPHTPSFPSGHSLNAMAIYGAFGLLAARHLRRRAVGILVLIVGFALPLLVGTTRPYLGVHYPSDVLAGWTAGFACALLALWADRRWGDRPRSDSSANAACGNDAAPTNPRMAHRFSREMESQP